MTEAVERFLARFFENMERVRRLVSVNALFVKAKVNDDVKSDILRSAVVFMHATLEELLREFATAFLPLGDEESLNTIPLAGSQPGARADKFNLGKLARFRGATVDNVLQQSVKEYLALSNYNDVGEVERLLRAMNFDSADIRKLYPKLTQMMSRRHQIVHRADVPAATSSGKAQRLSPKDVARWFDAIIAFAKHLVPKAVMRHLVERRALQVRGRKVALARCASMMRSLKRR